MFEPTCSCPEIVCQILDCQVLMSVLLRTHVDDPLERVLTWEHMSMIQWSPYSHVKKSNSQGRSEFVSTSPNTSVMGGERGVCGQFDTQSLGAVLKKHISLCAEKS